MLALCSSDHAGSAPGTGAAAGPVAIVNGLAHIRRNG
ncbi:hypothetical protein Tco_0602880, partial [Tanacetum coccineum]